MFKPLALLAEPDTRYRDQMVLDAGTGKFRGIGIDDLWNLMAAVELERQVPAAIREQFDLARSAFVYSWFVYEFATLAEQQCFATLEMALRHRLDPPALPNTTRSPGLDKLLKATVKDGWLNRDDFMVPGGLCLLDFIPRSRNHVMHGNVQLLPQGTPDILRLCADVINRLYVSARAGA
jgi:hypothetical protein